MLKVENVITFVLNIIGVVILLLLQYAPNEAGKVVPVVLFVLCLVMANLYRKLIDVYRSGSESLLLLLSIILMMCLAMISTVGLLVVYIQYLRGVIL